MDDDYANPLYDETHDEDDRGNHWNGTVPTDPFGTTTVVATTSGPASTGPVSTGTISAGVDILLGAVVAAAVDTVDSTGILRNGGGLLASLALLGEVDPAVESAYADLGPLDRLLGFFFSDVGAQYDQNAALNQQQKAGDGKLRAGSIGTVLGGSQYANTGRAMAEAKGVIRDATADATIEIVTASAGGFLSKLDDVNDLRKAARSRQFAKPVLVRLRKLKPFTRENFRQNLKILTGLNPSNAQAHHVLPIKFADRFKKADIEVHNPAFGAWWESSSHAANSRLYEDLWDTFFEENARPSRRLILEHARELSGAFGFDVIF